MSTISSALSVSLLAAEASASIGTIPRVSRVCLAGFSLLHTQFRLLEVSTGTATATTGIAGLYLLRANTTHREREREKKRKTILQVSG